MKINHQIPISGYFAYDDASIVNIEGNGQVEREVVFKEPEVALRNGEEYRVKAEGTWKAIWIHKSEGEDEGKLYLSDSVLVGSEYESNRIIVRISEEEGGDL